MTHEEGYDDIHARMTNKYKVDWEVWEKHIAKYKKLDWEKISTSSREVEVLGSTFKEVEFTDNIKNLMESIHFTHVRVKELKDLVNLLRKAKKAYVSDLKLEVISGKTGISFQEE